MTDNQHTIRVSAEAVSAIDSLVKRPEFGVFMDSLRRKRDGYDNIILTDEKITVENREKLRQRRVELDEIIRWPEQERQAHVAVLASFGVRPGDGAEVGMV